MIVAIHQPNYLPYLGFFHKMFLADVLVLYDTAQYSKNDFHNRNRIKTQERLMWLTVPVRRPTGREIRAVEADASKPWARDHWEAIRVNYAQAKYFGAYAKDVEAFYRQPPATLAAINRPLIEFLAGALGIKRRILWASELAALEEPSPSGKLVELTRRAGGDTYLSGPGGPDYLDRDMFAGLEVRVQEFRHPTYRQLWGKFIPNASALDAVLNLGDHAGGLLEECGQLSPFPSRK